MIRRTLESALLAAMLTASLAHAQQQLPKLPETYSFFAKSEGMWPKSTHKVNRNGPKELFEVRNESGDFHLIQLYDFQAQKVYTRDMNAKTCTVQKYTSPYLSVLQDPIGGWEEVRSGMATQPPKVLRTEKVNGIGAKVVDAVIGNEGKYTYWLDEKFGFPVKQTVTLKGQAERLLLEMRELTYAASPESLFTPPAVCTAVGGSTSTTGGHSETALEATASGTVQLGAAEPAAPASGKVIAVRLRLTPERYAGSCPGPVKLVGEITTDGPATVWYEFLAGAVRKRGAGDGTVRFTRAGTQQVTLDAEYVMTPSVPECILLAAEIKADGSHGPETVSSGPVPFNATCK
jgi:hypothetical protein